MTLRQYLKRRWIRVNLALIPFIGLAVLAGYLAKDHKAATASVSIVLLIDFAIFYWLMRKTKCLRCGNPVAGTAMKWIPGRYDQPECPHYRLGFDEPIEAG